VAEEVDQDQPVEGNEVAAVALAVAVVVEAVLALVLVGEVSVAGCCRKDRSGSSFIRRERPPISLFYLSYICPKIFLSRIFVKSTFKLPSLLLQTKASLSWV